MAGAPLGNTNKAKATRWANAIENAVDAWPDQYQGGANDFMRGINAAAYAFVRKMMEDGDIAFFKEFGDRIDGKPKQAIDVGGQADNPLVTISSTDARL